MKNKCSVHTFILPPPNGQKSLGVCKYCGVEKIHYNSIPDGDSPWRRTKEATWKTKIALEQ